MEKSLFNEEDVVYSYTSQQAEEDGILFDVTQINPQWAKGLFNYVTTNLLSRGYFVQDTQEINIPNILDLLNQSLEIVKKNTLKGTINSIAKAQDFSIVEKRHF